MNIYLKIDSILEQKNKHFNARYEVIENDKGYILKVKQPFEFAELPQFTKCRGGHTLSGRYTPSGYMIFRLKNQKGEYEDIKVGSILLCNYQVNFKEMAFGSNLCGAKVKVHSIKDDEFTLDANGVLIQATYVTISSYFTIVN